MQEKMRVASTEKIKTLLREYHKGQIRYNEPHFTLKLRREQIDRKEVVKNLLKPDRLVFVGVSASKNPNYLYVYDLYFQLKSYLIKIPTSMRPKCLYLITLFKIQGRINHEANPYKRK